MVPSTETVFSLPTPPQITSVFPCSNQLSDPCSYILNHLQKKEVAILSGQIFIQKRKCNCVSYQPTMKCHCLVFLLFKDQNQEDTPASSVLSPLDTWQLVLNMGTVCQQHKTPKNVFAYGAPGPLDRWRIMIHPKLLQCQVRTLCGCSAGEFLLTTEWLASPREHCWRCYEIKTF